MDQANPYGAPTAALGDLGAGPVPRRSAWVLLRCFPVIYGGLGVLVCGLEAGSSAVNIAALIHATVVPRMMRWGALAPLVVRLLGWTLAGLMATVATRDWYACRWRRAGWLTAGWIGLCILIESLLLPLLAL